MFDVDSFGSSADENEFVCDYDNCRIKKKKDFIYFKDNAYNIDLPWHEDEIKTVLPNYQVTHKKLDKTMKYLESKNSYIAP